MTRFFQNDIFSNPGDPIKILYSPVVQDDGSIELVESGKENFQAYIDSFAESTSIEYLMKRFQNGEFDVFNQRQGTYGDFTQFPKTYAEMLQLQIDAQKAFDHLPVDIKQKFDNDINKFIVSIGSDEWTKVMSPGSDVPGAETKIESEVTKE